jgi:hypothetical protein
MLVFLTVTPFLIFLLIGFARRVDPKTGRIFPRGKVIAPCQVEALALFKNEDRTSGIFSGVTVCEFHPGTACVAWMPIAIYREFDTVQEPIWVAPIGVSPQRFACRELCNAPD